MFQQNSLLNQTQTMPSTVMRYTFTTSELDSLRGKLQMAEQQMATSHSKNGSQYIIQLNVNEIRTLQRMIEMTYYQGFSNSGMVQSMQQNLNTSSIGMKSSSGGSTPSNYVCHKCGIPGHYVQDCPNVTGKLPPDNYLCHKCNIKGHWIQDCPLANQQDYSKAPPPGYCCYRCGVPGHWIKNCPTNNNSLDNSGSNQNNNQRDRDLSSNYGPRYKKTSSQQMNSQQMNMLTNNSNYLENNTKDTDERGGSGQTPEQ